MSLLPIAKLVGVFGVRGELKCTVGSAGADSLAVGQEYALDSEGRRTLRCTSARRQGDQWVLGFNGITTPEAASELVGSQLFVERARLKLRENEYLDEDLVGLRLCDPNGRELGTVLAVEHLPAHDYLVVGPKRALVPLVRSFIRSIDPKAGTIVADLPEGLLEG